MRISDWSSDVCSSDLQEGLEGYASGRFNSKAEVKRFFESHAGFPVTRHGHLTNEQANRIMTHPIYAGYVESKAWDVSLRPGQHEATISLATFHQVQERIAGKPPAPTRSGNQVRSDERRVGTECVSKERSRG